MLEVCGLGLDEDGTASVTLWDTHAGYDRFTGVVLAVADLPAVPADADVIAAAEASGQAPSAF